MTARKALILSVKVLLTALIVYYLFQQVSEHWAEVQDHHWEINWWILAASILAGIASFVIFSSTWSLIIASFGFHVSRGMAYRISYLANLGRYLPGRIWQVFGMLYMAKKVGVSEEATASSFVINQMFAIPASFLVFALAVWLEPRMLIDQVALLGKASSYLLMGGLLSLCAIVIFWPGPILALGNWVLKVFKRSPVNFRLDKSVALKVFAGYFLGWVVQGAAFWLFLKAIAPDNSPGLVASAGIYNAAYQIGYLALFAPGGFGPRELVMGALLTPFLGPTAAAFAILSRLWSVLVESLAAAIALLVRK